MSVGCCTPLPWIVLCALPGFAAPGGFCCLAPVRVPSLWPVSCLSGVPCGPAWCAAPCLVQVLWVLWSAFASPWCPPLPGVFAPRTTERLCRAHGDRPRTGMMGRSASYLFEVPLWGCPWRVPPASYGNGGPGHSRVRSPVPSVFQQGPQWVHRRCFVLTRTPLILGLRTPRPSPVRVCVCLSAVLACRSTSLFFWPFFFLLCSAYSGLGLPFSCPFVGLLSFASFFSFSRLPTAPAPAVFCFLWFWAQGDLGLGAVRFFSPPFCSSSFPLLLWLLVDSALSLGCFSLMFVFLRPRPPPFFCCLRLFVPAPPPPRPRCFLCVSSLAVARPHLFPSCCCAFCLAFA